MRYFIGCLIKGEVKEYQERLIERISQRFDVRNLNSHVPAHFTLKSPFETDNISEVEELLQGFCSSKEATAIGVNGIESFDKRIIFLDGDFPAKAEQIFRDLVKELGRIDWMTFRDYEFDKVHFHSTLARARDESQFFEIMDFLKDEQPNFEVLFDNLTIFENVAGKWRVYREFEFADLS